MVKFEMEQLYSLVDIWSNISLEKTWIFILKKFEHMESIRFTQKICYNKGKYKMLRIIRMAIAWIDQKCNG